MKKLSLILLLFFSIIIITHGQEENTNEDSELMTFELDSLISNLDASGRAWLPFIQGKNVLTGLYKLKAGAVDQQQPHKTDEVYYVVAGKGQFEAGKDQVNYKLGSIIFVKANVEHRFYDIEEDTILLVFFDQ